MFNTYNHSLLFHFKTLLYPRSYPSLIMLYIGHSSVSMRVTMMVSRALQSSWDLSCPLTSNISFTYWLNSTPCTMQYCNMLQVEMSHTWNDSTVGITSPSTWFCSLVNDYCVHIIVTCSGCATCNIHVAYMWFLLDISAESSCFGTT